MLRSITFLLYSSGFIGLGRTINQTGSFDTNDRSEHEITAYPVSLRLQPRGAEQTDYSQDSQ